ncbi:MAG: metal-dependent transcriptional regulator [Planctomycetota bacterium]
MNNIKKEQIDEFLELLFVAKEEGINIKLDNIPHTLPCFDAGVEFKNVDKNELLKVCIEKKYVEIDTEGIIKFHEIGWKKARAIVRKHRLAERLLIDILNLKEILIEKNACIFEHHLSSVVADRICIILNHPPVCPHNKPIPEGKCCKTSLPDRITPAVIPLKDASLNILYKVVYTKDFDTKLFLTLKSFGIYPGVTIRILQKYPELLLEIENTRIALERRVCDKIYILPIEDDESQK